MHLEQKRNLPKIIGDGIKSFFQMRKHLQQEHLPTYPDELVGQLVGSSHILRFPFCWCLLVHQGRQVADKGRKMVDQGRQITNGGRVTYLYYGLTSDQGTRSLIELFLAFWLSWLSLLSCAKKHKMSPSCCLCVLMPSCPGGSQPCGQLASPLR